MSTFSDSLEEEEEVDPWLFIKLSFPSSGESSSL
jgi:hypothetical protein